MNTTNKVEKPCALTLAKKLTASEESLAEELIDGLVKTRELYVQRLVKLYKYVPEPNKLQIKQRLEYRDEKERIIRGIIEKGNELQEMRNLVFGPNNNQYATR